MIPIVSPVAQLRNAHIRKRGITLTAAEVSLLLDQLDAKAALAAPTVAPAERPLVEALEMLAAQHSGQIASTAKADCMAAIASQTLANWRADQRSNSGEVK